MRIARARMARWTALRRVQSEAPEYHCRSGAGTSRRAASSIRRILFVRPELRRRASGAVYRDGSPGRAGPAAPGPGSRELHRSPGHADPCEERGADRDLDDPQDERTLDWVSLRDA